MGLGVGIIVVIKIGRELGFEEDGQRLIAFNYTPNFTMVNKSQHQLFPCSLLPATPTTLHG